MKINVFPSEEELGRELATFEYRVCGYAAFAFLFLLSFWLWHLNYTEILVRSTKGYDIGLPRFFDAVFVLTYTIVLLSGIRFSKYVHEQPVKYCYCTRTILDWTRKLLVHITLFGIIFLGIYDVWIGYDMLMISTSGVILLAISFLSYWYVTLILSLLHRFGAVSPPRHAPRKA